MNWEVGQTVWIVPSDCRSQQRSATIERVARRWVYLDSAPWASPRFDKTTGDMDGGEYMSPATVWPSQEAFEAWAHINKAWQTLRRTLPFSAPPHMTSADVALICSLVAGDRKGDILL